MRNTNKKGFTIVELVIVVAVIAILAAVLIPTFSGIINKANQSADQQAVANMNKLLAMNEKAADVDGVIEILIKEGYKGDLSTYFKDYELAWLASENVIVLVQDNAVVYPKANAGATGYEVINPMATDAGALTGGLTAGDVVYVGGDIAISDYLAPGAAGDYAVKLNGNTLNASNIVGSWVDGAKLVVSNGVIDGSSITDDDGRVVVVYASMGGTVELKNVQVVAPEGANTIQCYGATMVLDNVTAAQSGNAEVGYYNSAIQIVDGYGENDQYRSHLTVNGGVYTGNKALQMSLPGGTVIINGGVFAGNEAIHMDSNGVSYPDHAHSITINGGNFTGAIYGGVGSEIIINGGTFSINPETDITGGATVTINGSVVDNGNGTWTVK